MNKEFEKYLSDLSPEQQEKAKACKTKEELMQLAAEEDVEIPMEALENVAGGCATYEYYCKRCGSTNIDNDYDSYDLRCYDCGSYNIGKRVIKE